MGPRLVSRGNYPAGKQTKFTNEIASMGPRLVSRGNVREVISRLLDQTGLQWGRGLLAAEISQKSGHELAISSLLQWGRGLLAVEIHQESDRSGEHT